MKKKLFFIFFVCFGLFKTTAMSQIPVNYIQVSQDLLYAAKTDDSTEIFTGLLAAANENELAAQLDNDDKRLAFWLNIYNAFTQFTLKKNPEKYKKRSAFYKEKMIVIAGKRMNLDAVEHDILRHSQIKWGLGYIGKLFPGRFEKKFRVQHKDWRIHFALNCGAKSCPPIAFYKPEQINQQLKLSTINYLRSDCTYDSTTNRIGVPALMSWFRGDFGGRKKILPILREYKVIPENARPKVYFKKYDWDLYLDNYKMQDE
jgi:Protein of unknown function, DUF547